MATRRPPIGAIGAPSGPRADLSQADTRSTKHNLYVKVVTGADPDHKSRDLTLQVLRYIHESLPMFQKMDLAVRVTRVRSQDLQDPRFVAAMRRRGITRLPAMTTPNNVYIGFNEIRDIYSRNLKEFTALSRRGDRPIEGIAPDGDLESYYQDEMTFARAAEDADETGLGDNDEEGMMNAYRHMMAQREAAEAGRKQPAAPSTRRGRPAPVTSGRRAPPARSTAPGRPDNLGPAPPPSLDPYDAEIQNTINRLARDIDDNVRSRAFAPSDDGVDGDEDARDDLMERAFYSNLDATDL